MILCLPFRYASFLRLIISGYISYEVNVDRLIVFSDMNSFSASEKLLASRKEQRCLFFCFDSILRQRVILLDRFIWATDCCPFKWLVWYFQCSDLIWYLTNCEPRIVQLDLESFIRGFCIFLIEFLRLTILLPTLVKWVGERRWSVLEPLFVLFRKIGIGPFGKVYGKILCHGEQKFFLMMCGVGSCFRRLWPWFFYLFTKYGEICLDFWRWQDLFVEP